MANFVFNPLTGNLEIDSSGSGSLNYSNSTPVPSAVGGIEAGTTFTNRTIQQVFDALLYPYQSPTLTITSNLGTTRTIEVGEKIFNTNTALTFNYSATNSANLNTGSIQYFQDNVSITNPFTLADYNSTPNVRSTPGSHTWRASALNTRGQTVNSNNIVITSAHRTFTGYSTDPNVTDYSNLTAIGNSLNRPTSVVKPSTGSSVYTYIFLPNSYSTYSNFTSGGFAVPMFPTFQSTLSRLGISVVYNVYRTLNPTSGSFTLNLS